MKTSPLPGPRDRAREKITRPLRLGWLATAGFVEINGVGISRAGNDDVDDLVIDIAAGQPTVDAIAERIRHLAT